MTQDKKPASKPQPLKKDIPSLAPKDIRDVLEGLGIGLDADESKKVANQLTKKISK